VALHGLWTTFVAGFSYMVLGFEITTVVSAREDGPRDSRRYAIYVTYGDGRSYLGSRTGQTHALLTRSVFGRLGSGIGPCSC